MSWTLSYRGLFVLILLFPSFVFTQIRDINRETLEKYPRQLIDCPTANNCPRHGIEMKFRMFEEGGLLMGMSIGITNELMVYGSYGGMNVLGEGPIDWNPSPGVGLRYKIKSEDWSLPTVAFGFGVLAAIIARQKTRSGLLWFVIGFLLGGILISITSGVLRSTLRHTDQAQEINKVNNKCCSWLNR